MQKNDFLKPNFEITAKSLKGFEQILADEIKQLGGTDIKIQNRAVKFTGNKKLLYKANLHLKTALRILVPIWKFKLRNEQDLYKNVKKIYWDRYLNTNQTFAIDTVVNSKLFNHSKYISYKTKDAIADFFREKYNKRPNVDVINPNIRINVHISKDFCTVSLDSSGTSLNQRGYRKNPGEAPLNEVLAAGIILQSDWDKNSNFIDLMCGSGTFLIEATLMALNIPPNFYRPMFGFEKWSNFDRELWSDIIYKAKSKRKKKLDFKIIGVDVSQKAILTSQQNISSINLNDYIELVNKDFRDYKNTLSQGTIITNPPYGERIKVDNLNKLYKDLGDKLKIDFSDFSAWIFIQDSNTYKKIELHPSKKISLLNGQLDCKLLNYKLYKGTKKQTT